MKSVVNLECFLKSEFAKDPNLGHEAYYRDILRIDDDQVHLQQSSDSNKKDPMLTQIIWRYIEVSLYCYFRRIFDNRLFLLIYTFSISKYLFRTENHHSRMFQYPFKNFLAI